jgi:hypothetical protein
MPCSFLQVQRGAGSVRGDERRRGAASPEGRKTITWVLHAFRHLALPEGMQPEGMPQEGMPHRKGCRRNAAGRELYSRSASLCRRSN